MMSDEALLERIKRLEMTPQERLKEIKGYLKAHLVDAHKGPLCIQMEWLVARVEQCEAFAQEIIDIGMGEDYIEMAENVLSTGPS